MKKILIFALCSIIIFSVIGLVFWGELFNPPLLQTVSAEAFKSDIDGFEKTLKQLAQDESFSVEDAYVSQSDIKSEYCKGWSISTGSDTFILISIFYDEDNEHEFYNATFVASDLKFPLVNSSEQIKSDVDVFMKVVNSISLLQLNEEKMDKIGKYLKKHTKKDENANIIEFREYLFGYFESSDDISSSFPDFILIAQKGVSDNDIEYSGVTKNGIEESFWNKIWVDRCQ